MKQNKNFDSVICRIRDLLLFCLKEVFNHLFIFLVVCVITGIYLGHFGYDFLPGVYAWFIIPLILFYLCVVFNIHKKSFIVVLFTAILFSFFGNFLFVHYTQKILCKKELVHLFDNKKVIGITGVVIGDSVWNKINESNQVVKQTFPFKVESATLESGEVNISGKINVVWLTGAYDRDNMPFYGDRIKLGGLYCNTKFESQGVDKYILKVSARSWKSEILENSVLSSGLLMPFHKYKSFCFRLRQETLPIFDLGLGNFSDVSGVLKSIIIGRRVFLSSKFKEGLISTGTIHIIAVSGLHAGIVAGIIIMVLKLFGFPRYHWFYILAPIMVTYTLYTGARPSAIRACLMLLIYYLSYAINRKSNILSTVAISAFIILVVNPIELFDLGFIFSFATVLGLILLFPPIYEIITTEKKIDDNDFIPPPHDDKSFKEKVVSFVAVIFVVSLVAWFVSMPLTIHFFNRAVFIAPVVNVFVVPLTFCLILLGLLTLSSACILSYLPYIFNGISILVVKLLEYIIYAASEFRYGKVENVHLHNCEFLFYIPMIAIVFYYKVLKIRRSSIVQQKAKDKQFARENFE
jgi:ComEC/Rec2-related protein